MFIGSACLLIPELRYIGPPDYVHVYPRCTWFQERNCDRFQKLMSIECTVVRLGDV